MDEVVKKEELDVGLTMVGCKGRSWQKQQHQQDKKMQQTRLSLPTRIASSTPKNQFRKTHNSSSSSVQHFKSGQHHRTPAASKQRSVSSASSAYSLGARCGEIFVANNAKQWTFVCTFCNKSTRDIGDFICHIKIKHLEESDESPPHYDNDYYNEDDDNGRDDDDDDAYSQAQDYLDCGNYLDINVHTEPEELTYSNGDKYSDRRQNNSSTILQHRSNENNWKRPKQEQLQRHSKQQKISSEQKGPNVQIADESDNEDEDVQETRRKISKLTNIKQHRLKQYAPKRSAHNGATPMGVKNERDTPPLPDNAKQNDDDYVDEDFDSQLLLAPTDPVESSTPNNEGRIKRRQIRGTAYCALCNKTFQYYSLYRNHMIKHSNETPFKCSLCQKGFKSKQAIRYHMNTHQKEAKFKCEICETGFHTENHFITHVLTHENANTYPCMVCGKVLQSEKERDVHLTAHTEERPFQCEFCHKLFRLRHHLSNHLKMHRQYRCEYCKEEFTSAVHLRKPYACPVCENSTEARTAAENALQHVNPLRLFEAVLPPTQPTECVDLAEMVSDSNEHEYDNEDEDEEEEGTYENGDEDEDEEEEVEEEEEPQEDDQENEGDDEERKSIPL